MIHSSNVSPKVNMTQSQLPNHTQVGIDLETSRSFLDGLIFDHRQTLKLRNQPEMKNER